MRSLVVTSFSPAGGAAYGYRCVRSLQAAGVPPVVYLDVARTLAGTETRSTALIPGWPETRTALPMSNPVATNPDRYTWQAQRFAVKPFVWRDAARRLGVGTLTWLDADTEAIAPVPDGFFASLLWESDVAYLGRGTMHPETGYVGFRVPQALPLLDWCVDAYTSGRFRELNGWTDCHVLRAGLEATRVPSTNLTADTYCGKSHVWPVSPLAPYLTHHKGTLKKAVASC